MLINLLKITKFSSILALIGYLFVSFRTFSRSIAAENVSIIDGSSARSLNRIIDKIHPILIELTQQKFFHYFRVDVSTKCPFWGAEAKCKNKQFCKLNCDCPTEKLPSTWVAEDMKIRENNAFSKIEFADIMKPIKQKKDNWSFDEITDNSIYVDLLDDKEQYTGYQGQKIWKALYEDHCMKISSDCGSGDFLYKMISGMHTSVSSHLTEYFVEFSQFNQSQIVYPKEEFYFEKVGNFPERIQNLRFAVQILLRSFVRYIDLIKNFNVDTGEFSNDMKTKQLIQKLVNILGDEKDKKFDESLIFGTENNIQQKREAYLRYFTNMTKVMDCVDCMKCKAYGKMQILGLSVALRILIKKSDTFLTRNELVAYVNTLNKWTESVKIVSRMRQRFLNRMISELVYYSVFLMIWLSILEYIIKKIKQGAAHELKSD